MIVGAQIINFAICFAICRSLDTLAVLVKHEFPITAYSFLQGLNKFAHYASMDRAWHDDSTS